jgi:CHAT domain-containing protein
VFAGHVRAALHVAERAPKRNAVLVDEAFRLVQWAHHSDAGLALSQMAARFASRKGELPALVRRRQDLVWRSNALDAQLVASAAKPAEARDAVREQEWRAELTRLDQAIRDADLTLKARFPDYAALANPEPLPIRAVQRQLRDNEALYQVMIGKDESFAWVVTRHAVRARILPISEKALDEDVAALRCGLDPSNWDPTEDAQAQARRRDCERLLAEQPADEAGLPFDLERAYRLYQKLLAPFESLIRGRHLFVVPSGSLTTLPLHVLVTAPPDRATTGMARYAKAAWLARRQPLTVLPSVSSLRALRSAALRSQAAQPFLALANPLLLGSGGDNREAWAKQACPSGPPADVPQTVAARPPAPARAVTEVLTGGLVDLARIRRQPPLPETADEVCAVARDLGAAETDVLLGARATESALKTLSASGALKSYRVVHFATHGLVAGETESLARSKAEPALILTPPETDSEDDDGLLTASEVAELTFDADAVVLSACNTASASGRPGAEPLSGLARAFLYAGTRALLVTHWQVNSQAAVELVTATFAERRRDPAVRLAEALRRSMSALIARGGAAAHPSHWAPFVVVGESAR